jgi:uncharacterized protein (UPF0332 family)
VSPANQRIQIDAEVAKGDAALRAAEALVGLGLFDDAVTRFYYAAFHYASAALLAVGVEATSHQGLPTLFSQHLVRTGALDAERARELKRLQGYREAADYDRHFHFDGPSADAEGAVARRFIEGVRALLRARRGPDAP